MVFRESERSRLDSEYEASYSTRRVPTRVRRFVRSKPKLKYVIKKYLSYRYFSHLWDNRSIRARINNFDTAFTVFRRTYTFSADELLAIKKLVAGHRDVI